MLKVPDEDGVLQEMKDQFESATGLDIDGDGYVGKPPTSGEGVLTLQVPDQSGLLEDMKNQFESYTGLDIDGDGHVGKPPSDTAPIRAGGVGGLLARAFRGRVISPRRFVRRFC